MTDLQPKPFNQENEVLYWLDLAKRILGGELSLDEARLVLKSSVPYAASPGVTDGTER